MADILSSYQSRFGSWQAVFTQLESIQGLSREDLQSAAKEVFTYENSFEALMPRT
jgi:predicted Zn-dependent peptidase